MNREYNIGQNITNLRKKNKVTQEQLAAAINVTPQAVSKWENAVCQPDTSTLPLLADFFHVSIDYLFYGYEDASDDIYEQITNRVCSKSQGNGEAFEEAVKISSVAQHGIMYGHEKYFRISQRGKKPLKNIGLPIHLLSSHGFSICSPKGFSAIVTDKFLNSVDGKTMKRAKRIFETLADEDCLRVTMEILNFHGISWLELKEKTKFDEERLANAIEMGKKAGFIEEVPTAHEFLIATYIIQRHHYNCLCLILATVRMIGISLRGATRSMWHPKFSMSFDCDEATASSIGNQPSDETK